MLHRAYLSKCTIKPTTTIGSFVLPHSTIGHRDQALEMFRRTQIILKWIILTVLWAENRSVIDLPLAIA